MLRPLEEHRRNAVAALGTFCAGSATATTTALAHCDAFDAGIGRVGAMSGMVLEHPCADTIVETQAVDRDNAQDYLDLQRAQLGTAAQHVARPEVLLRGDVRARVARVDGVPAACGMVVTTGTTAGLYWVWTLERYRHRGLGEAIARRLCRDAFDHGARQVVPAGSSRAGKGG